MHCLDSSVSQPRQFGKAGNSTAGELLKEMSGNFLGFIDANDPATKGIAHKAAV
jgi:hypothetical protein